MRKILAGFLLVALLFGTCVFAESYDLPDISDLTVAQLKELKENINARLVDLGELYDDIKKGSKGENVSLLQERLIDLGYLEGEPTGVWDNASIMAMKAYEKVMGIKKQDGAASAEEQKGVFSESAPSKPIPTPKVTPTPKPPKATATPKPTATVQRISDDEEDMVWIPKTGKKYHSKSSCSNMKSPSHVSLSVAKSKGLTPCSKCNPPK